MKKPLLFSAGQLALCLVLLITFTSCEKGVEPDPKKEQNSCQMTKMILGPDSTQITTFQYDKQNRLLQSILKFDGNNWEQTDYDYNSSGKLARLIRKGSVLRYDESVDNYTYVYLFEYNSAGQISQYKISELLGSGTNILSATECEYDQAGNRTKTITTFTNGSEPITNLYTYLDGNCVKAVLNAGSSSETITEYEYYLDREDNHKQFNLAYSLQHYTERTASKNLLKFESYTYKRFDLSLNFQRSYEFNQQGYPIKLHIIYPDSFTSKESIYTMKYNCL